MSLKKYDTFLKVVELGSLTNAARALEHTQSGITHILHSLEDDLGFCLMKRDRSGITLTDEGKEILPYIKEVIAANERLEEKRLQITHAESNTIRIGTFTSVAVNWLPTIIKEYQAKSEDIQIELIDGGYDDIIQKLSEQKVDIGFVTIPNDLTCKCIPLYEDRLLAVLPTKHPLAGRVSLPVHFFETEPVISLMADTDRDTRTVLNASGITPNIKFRTKDDYAMIAMVEKNLGICIVPELLLHGTNNRVTVMELDPPAKRMIGIALPAYDTASPAVKEFAQFIIDWVSANKNSEIKIQK